MVCRVLPLSLLFRSVKTRKKCILFRMASNHSATGCTKANFNSPTLTSTTEDFRNWKHSVSCVHKLENLWLRAKKLQPSLVAMTTATPTPHCNGVTLTWDPTQTNILSPQEFASSLYPALQSSQYSIKSPSARPHLCSTSQGLSVNGHYLLHNPLLHLYEGCLLSSGNAIYGLIFSVGQSQVQSPLNRIQYVELLGRAVRCPDFRGCNVYKQGVRDSQMCPVYRGVLISECPD